MKRAMCSAVLAIALLAACESAEERPSDYITMPPWAESGPKAADYFRVYPSRAREIGLEGDVRLRCVVRDDRKLACKRDWEQYPDMGFDIAALAVASLFVVKRSDSPNLQPGKEVILPIAFRLEY